MKTTNLDITKESIAIRAYEIYLNGGCQDGHAEEHWLRAEAELKGACLPTEPALVKKQTKQEAQETPKAVGTESIQTTRKGATTTRKKTSTAGQAQVGIQKGLESKPAPI